MSIPARSAARAAAIFGAAFLTQAPSGDARSAVERPPVVIELFTSQGCSSCPPADALLEDYARRDGVIALSFHVDYWDYLGWKDELASSEFSQRQRDYARARGDGAVYTPQAVVNGRVDVVGSSAEGIVAALGAPATQSVEVEATVTGTRLDVRVGEERSRPVDADILVAMVQPSATVQIRRGENSGRTITYRNVVRSLTRIGGWNGTAVALAHPIAAGSGGASYVVLLQHTNAGPILGAAVAETLP
jgi:hypothetical protein